MTEQQEYRVLESRDGVELREYAPCVVADVVVEGTLAQATNAAFRPLFDYISGANAGSTSLDMTSPVIQQASGEQLAMTAPVLQEATGDRRWTVSFVLPGSRPIGDYPTPLDPRVTLRQIPTGIAAALPWSGAWTEENVARRTDELRRGIAQAGWMPVGDPRWARFDPPWTPDFARRNEIVIPVSAA